MLRKAVLFLASVMISTGVLAIGLGEMNLKSGLSEPLRAEIELLSVNADELDGIKVALGSASDFSRLGVERPFFLTKLKFKTAVNANGKPVIQVQSKDSFKEPFLDVVIEVTWSKGRLLREYTALIDPPVLVKQQAAPVATAAVATSRPIAKEQAATPTPITPADTATGADDELFPNIPLDGAPSSAPAFSGDSYGPTKRSDTLWSVAKKVKTDEDVSMEQMMLAITRTNPQAFIDGNVNTIKDGYVLRIPDRAEAMSITKREAHRVVNEHHRIWKEMRAGQTYRATPERGAARDTDKTGVTAPADDAKLKVIAGKADEKVAIETGADSKHSGEIKKQIEHTTQAAEKVRAENESLQGKVQELEQKLADMERSISIKDKELATLQESLERSTSVTDKAVRSNKDMNPYAIKEIPEEKAPATPAPAQEQPTPAAEAPKPAPAPQPKAQPQPQPQQQTVSFVDELLGNPLMLAAAVALLLLVGALGWMMVGKRRVSRMKMDFQESILTGKPVSGAPAEAGPVSTTVEEDSSFLSDFSVSGIEGIQTEMNDVDPVAEADVYVAYGRHKQAEELINDAIAKEPGRHELKVKLLEIYYSARNKDAFEAQAEELYAVLGGQAGPMWDKVVAMGKDLCPDNPLFGAAAVVEPAAAEIEPAPDEIQQQDEVLDIGLDDSQAQPVAEIPEIGEDMAAEDTLAGVGMETAESAFTDSGLGESVLEEPETEPALSFETETAEAEEEELDFSLDLDETALEEEVLSEDTGLGESVEKAASDITEASDLDFTLDEEEGAGLGEEAESSELDGGFYAEEDEVSTKLDLAKAYIDMGDPDGARSILTEVLEEGNAGQKQEANELMQQIS